MRGFQLNGEYDAMVDVTLNDRQTKVKVIQVETFCTMQRVHINLTLNFVPRARGASLPVEFS